MEEGSNLANINISTINSITTISPNLNCVSSTSLASSYTTVTSETNTSTTTIENLFSFITTRTSILKIKFKLIVVPNLSVDELQFKIANEVINFTRF